MATTVITSASGATENGFSEGKKYLVGVEEGESDSNSHSEPHISENGRPPMPLKLKIIAVLLVSIIGFGAHWSSGITGAMKTAMKKEMRINNTQFSLLEASEDFMMTVLIMFSGMLTDRIGGASAIVYGNAIVTIGSILVAGAAQTRSYKFMIVGRIVAALGDVATQVAQFKIFASWFAPNGGFGSTLGLEIGLAKIGAFVGKSSANIIARNVGFAWVFWVAVLMNIFTNFVSFAFYWLRKYSLSKYSVAKDTATGEELTEKSKKFELRRVLELPWVFWCVIGFSFFQTSLAAVFQQNATELAEQRFKTDSVTAGWYSSTVLYAGFFISPLLGIFIDLFGNRITVMVVCGVGVFLSMVLVTWAPTIGGTAAAFGIWCVAFSLGPTAIIESIRTSMWHQSVFGGAYATKVLMSNAMNIIVRVITGVVQDQDHDRYERVVYIYLALAAGTVLVSSVLVTLSFYSVDLGRLQWTRKQRLARSDILAERKVRFYDANNGPRNKKISHGFMGALALLTVGTWCAFFWGLATGKNY